MVNILITYDVQKNHSEVKKAMIDKGYSDTITGHNKKIRLPNTTLSKVGVTPSQAKADLIQIAKDTNANLEKVVTVQFIDVDGE